jgi:beta-galactosidase
MPVHEKRKVIGVKHFLILYIFLIAAANSGAQEFKTSARLIVSQNSNWMFAKDSAKNMDLAAPAISWLPVSLPHTWNVADVTDDQPGYYRGVGWYRRTLTVERSWKGRQLFLYFEGANQETVVFINGKKAGSHTGGYTAFCVPISPFLKPGGQPNEIMVKVDNSLNENVPPISADFTFYGGLYRSVSLVAVNEIHFSQPANAAKAVYISTPEVSEKTAAVHIRGSFVNSSHTKVKIKISSSVYDRQHKLVKLIHTLVDVDPGKEKEFTQLVEAIGHPRLWSPGDPYLYTVTTRLTDVVSAKILDEVSNPLGFRWFNFDADKGFFLNGKSYN